MKEGCSGALAFHRTSAQSGENLSHAAQNQKMAESGLLDAPQELKYNSGLA